MQLSNSKKYVGNYFTLRTMKLMISIVSKTYGESHDKPQYTNTKVIIMLTDDCRRCKHMVWMVGIGFGVRCRHPDNQHYKLAKDDQNMDVLISRVPDNCLLREAKWKRKMILHIPHSSTFVPETFHVFEDVSLEEEYQRMTDWFTDELFDFDEALKCIFPYSRLYCDVERFRADKDEPMAKKGMGVCYTRSSFGKKFRDVDEQEKAFIKSTFYDEHHRYFTDLVSDELDKNGMALIIDCHSFSNEVLPHEESDERPDICIGTDIFHTSMTLIKDVYHYFIHQGYTVAVNKPFSGTMVPLKYYKKDKRVQSIMIEVNRKLYLNGKFEQNDKFHKIKELIHTLLKNMNERYQLNHF